MDEPERCIPNSKQICQILDLLNFSFYHTLLIEQRISSASFLIINKFISFRLEDKSLCKCYCIGEEITFWSQGSCNSSQQWICQFAPKTRSTEIIFDELLDIERFVVIFFRRILFEGYKSNCEKGLAYDGDVRIQLSVIIKSGNDQWVVHFYCLLSRTSNL